MTQSWVEVDLERLRENVRAIRAAVSENISIVFVVKADAYGHGIEPVVKAAAEAGIDWFAVVHLSEAWRVRSVLPNANILILGVIDPSDVKAVFENRAVPIISSTEHGQALAAEARRLNITLPVHLKVDTGMGRIGIQWDDVETVLPKLTESEGIKLTGVCSHFASANPESLNDTIAQADRFRHILQFLPNNIFRHFCNSSAAFYFSDMDFDGIRQGIALYGYETGDPNGRFHTKPILQWKTRIVQIKDVPEGYRVGYSSTHITKHPTRIAVIAVGYSDGYNRLLSNCGDVLVRGRRCTVAGRVSMNWVAIDLGPDLPAEVGDEVVLIGEQGEDAVWADELARTCNTISYEILTSINASVGRHYKGIAS